MASNAPSPGPSDPRVVAVLGASGRVGAASVDAFRAAGWSVLAVVRPGRALGSRDGVETRAADARDPEALAEACRGAAVIVNGLNPPYPEWPAKALPLAEAALHAAEATGATLLFPGNVYNYGPELPPRLDPATPFDPGPNRKGAIRVQVEAALEAASRRGVQTLVLRAGDFYGVGTGSWMDLVLLGKLPRGRFTYPGPLDVEHAWAYLPDLARAFVRLAEARHRFATFEARCFPGHTLTGAELKALVEAAVGRPLKTGSVPWPLLRLAGLFSPMMREISEMAYLWRRPHRLVDPELEARVGALDPTPPERAVADAVRALHPEAVPPAGDRPNRPKPA